MVKKSDSTKQQPKQQVPTKKAAASGAAKTSPQNTTPSKNLFPKPTGNLKKPPPKQRRRQRSDSKGAGPSKKKNAADRQKKAVANAVAKEQASPRGKPPGKKTAGMRDNITQAKQNAEEINSRLANHNGGTSTGVSPDEQQQKAPPPAQPNRFVQTTYSEYRRLKLVPRGALAYVKTDSSFTACVGKHKSAGNVSTFIGKKKVYFNSEKNIQNLSETEKNFIDELPCRYCTRCNMCNFSANGSFLNTNSTDTAHERVCEKYACNPDITELSIPEEDIDEIVTQFFTFSGASAHQVQRVCQILYTSKPELFAFMKKYSNNIARYFNPKSADSLVLKAVDNLESFLKDLVKEKRHLTIYVDAGKHDGTHLIVVSICLQEKLYVLRPQVIKGKVDSKNVVKAMQDALKTVKKNLSDVGFIVADAGSSNQCAVRNMDAYLKALSDEENIENTIAVTLLEEAHGKTAEQMAEFREKQDQEDLDGDPGMDVEFQDAQKIFEEIKNDQNLMNGNTALLPCRIYVVACIGHYAHNMMKWAFVTVNKHFECLFSVRLLATRCFGGDQNATRREDYLNSCSRGKERQTMNPEKRKAAIQRFRDRVNNDAESFITPGGRKKLFSDMSKEAIALFPNSTLSSTKEIAQYFYETVNSSIPSTDGEKDKFVYDENGEDEPEMEVGEVHKLVQALDYHLDFAKNYIINSSEVGKGIRTNFRSSGQTRYASAHFQSVEHIFFNFQMIIDWLESQRDAKNRFCESMFHLAEEVADCSKSFLTEAELYFIVTRPIALLVEYFSDHNLSINEDVHTIICTISDCYSTMVDVFEKILSKVDTNHSTDKLFFDGVKKNRHWMPKKKSKKKSKNDDDDQQEDGNADDGSGDDDDEVVTDPDKISRAQKNLSKAKKSACEWDAVGEKDKEEKNKEEQDDNEIGYLDGMMQLSSGKDDDDEAQRKADEDALNFQIDRIMKSCLFPLSPKKKKMIFEEKFTSIIHQYCSSEKALQILVDTCRAFVVSFSEERWNRYQRGSEYQNRSLWKLCEILSPAKIHTTMGTGPRRVWRTAFDSAWAGLRERCGSLDTLDLSNEIDIIQQQESSLSRDEALKMSPLTFWNHPSNDHLPKFRELANAIFNVAPVVTSVDTFFSITGAITNKRRLITRNSLNIVLLQCYLHANGDISGKNYFMPRHFCDKSTIAQRRAWRDAMEKEKKEKEEAQQELNEEAKRLRQEGLVQARQAAEQHATTEDASPPKAQTRKVGSSTSTKKNRNDDDDTEDELPLEVDDDDDEGFGDFDFFIGEEEEGDFDDDETDDDNDEEQSNSKKKSRKS